MAARAMWKGAVCFAGARIPVKLFAAAKDQNVHFRLLHRKDKVPVKQAMVEPDSSEVIPYEDTRRAYVSEDGDLVIFDDEDLEALHPEPSRDIEIMHFLPPEAIDHRWYLRPYYLGPDGAAGKYAALISALEKADRIGLARWVMRKKAYVGALGLHDGYPSLVSLRNTEQVVSMRDLPAPKGRKLDKKELDMARRLIGMLEADFDPDEYEDNYRARVLDLIETKRRGGKAKVVRFRRPKPSEDLAEALEASLKQERKSA